jgi:hypothetical protein
MTERNATIYCGISIDFQDKDKESRSYMVYLAYWGKIGISALAGYVFAGHGRVSFAIHAICSVVCHGCLQIGSWNFTSSGHVFPAGYKA